MIITLGLTESDRDADYVSFSDGYRHGAPQQLVTITLEGDGSQYDAEQWAEAAFVASNHLGEAPAGPTRAIQLALAEQVTGPLRSLSVGDTVTVRGQMWACENSGWRRVDLQPGDPR
ncbi:hypothetical protein O7627_36835 [Solwaraspora sp. WMMD1047]|uniref:hypothetical protein n=1 Tax=Solwaraspora sp. WMMD1047 TaxID=3016102 RepID=UPI002415D155|nr:hypothetical protein [Solwaraspora sp. WMMD1047]MDG4834837.1 hypothetical protein [Solwaraspora sp. WMMD1047]